MLGIFKRLSTDNIIFDNSLGLSLAFVAINYIAAPSKPDPEKLSAYECGFEPFNDSRMEFDVRFYLVAILFIIFDLEIAFLFPWAISLVRWFIWFLLYDVIFIYFNSWFHIRMEKRSIRLGIK